MSQEPITRLEKIISGEEIKPITRAEKILSGEDLKPITRFEYFLKKYKGGTSGGGGGGGDTPSGENKLAKVVERTATEITAEDLKGCTKIGKYAFSNCSGLTSITIPESVARIENAAFSYCAKMQYYDFTACTSIPTLSSESAFNNIPSTCEIRVPMALVDEWKAATNWSTYASQIVGV